MKKSYLIVLYTCVPGAECLDPNIQNKSLEVIGIGNTSLTFRLSIAQRPAMCQAISMPAIKYTLYYTELPSDSQEQPQCDQTNLNCSKLVSASLNCNQFERAVLKLYKNWRVLFQLIFHQLVASWFVCHELVVARLCVFCPSVANYLDVCQKTASKGWMLCQHVGN